MTFKRSLMSVRIGLICAALSICLGALSSRADGLRDNDPANVRPIPPIGNDLDPADRDALQADADPLLRTIDDLKTNLKDRPELLAFLPDIQIYLNAVQYPLKHRETIELGMARKAIADGMERARALRDGKTPWSTVTGPRGYRSRVDGSVQPYILGVPASYRSRAAGQPAKPYRLDVWGHGRDELLTELRFVEMDDYLHELRYLDEPLEPDGKFILSLYGRYITAYKFAGEIDGLEAMQAVRAMYPIDSHRMLIIGFSLGGTCAWQYAVHYPDLWAAASPGAGFAETPDFLRDFQKEDVSKAPWYQQALWHLYNSTDYVVNLSNLPTIAYAGELDPQKQASDMMLKAASIEGVKIDRIIGKGIGHHFTLEAMRDLNGRLDATLSRGRDPDPAKIRFTTWTLRYNKIDWLTVDGLEHHWQRATVEGTHDKDNFTLTTQNVTALTLSIPAEEPSSADAQKIRLSIDGQHLDGGAARADGCYLVHLARANGAWKREDAVDIALSKRHGLQGPIDDAFMDRFLIVRPTGKPFSDAAGKWEQIECDHAVEQWFRQFRGEPRVKDDVDVTDADIAEGNLILFGDPASNKMIARIADALPIRWTKDSIGLLDRSFDATHHAAVLIYPNPLNPTHYIVLNSGFTYREYDYLNNARQTPKLPDYAVIDVTVPATAQSPGGIAAAGFFDESWKLQSDDGRAGVGAPAKKPEARETQ